MAWKYNYDTGFVDLDGTEIAAPTHAAGWLIEAAPDLLAALKSATKIADETRDE